MEYDHRTRDHQDGTVTSAVSLNSRAPTTDVGPLRSGVGPAGGLTLCERWAIEARIARISVALQELEDHVRRLRQGGGPLARGVPASPASAPRRA
jgi:hypothetical protein